MSVTILDQNDKEELKQLINERVKNEELQNVINDALTQAKESGEFDGEKGDKGDTGPKGETGPQGPAGSDATVTSENIKAALGYTPADQNKVNELSEEYLGLDWLPKIITNETVLFEEQTVVVDEKMTTIDVYHLYDLEIDKETRTKMVNEYDSITVVVDGVETKLPVCRIDDSNAYFFIGSSIHEGTVAVGSGNAQVAGILLTVGTHTIKVSHTESHFNKMPVEYLPDGVPYLSESTELFPLTELLTVPDSDGGFAFPSEINLVVGEKYTVNWNGVDYETECVEIEDGGYTAKCLGDIGLMTGGTSTGEPFIFVYAPDLYADMGYTGMANVLDGSSSVVMSISKGSQIRKLPEELLPDAFVEKVNKISKEIDDLGGSTDYIKTEAETVADLILEKMSANCLVGAIVTDIHRERNQTATDIAITHAGMGISEIRKITPLDFVANLGDNGESEDAHKFIYSALYNAILGTDSFWLRGNHEGSAYNYSDGTEYEYLVTDDEVYKFVGIKNKGHIVNADDRKGMYGYKDYEDLRLRIIYLNTSEIFENSISDSTANVIMTTTQINWLQNTALNFTGKTDVDKWKVLVLSHAPLDWNASTQQAITVLDNYVSNGGGAKIIGNIHGHVHNCNVGTIGTNEIPRIAIPQVCADRYNEYSSYGDSYAKWGEFAEDGTTPIYYYKGTGDATDTMFCVVVIDCENEKFYAINFGTTTATTSDGSYTKTVRVREISFTGDVVIPDEPDVPVETYTNQIKSSVNADGSEYVGHNGEDGYSADYRVNSSGTEVAQSGMCVTGYIPYNSETIELANITVSGTKDAYIAQYQPDKTFKQVLALTSVLTDDGTGVLTGSMTHTGFIRITCGVIDDTSILTLDEEII